MHENSLKTQYSVGVVYFNINNLKHLLTYLRCNELWILDN